MLSACPYRAAFHTQLRPPPSLAPTSAPAAAAAAMSPAAHPSPPACTITSSPSAFASPRTPRFTNPRLNSSSKLADALSPDPAAAATILCRRNDCHSRWHSRSDQPCRKQMYCDASLIHSSFFSLAHAFVSSISPTSARNAPSSTYSSTAVASCRFTTAPHCSTTAEAKEAAVNVPP